MSEVILRVEHVSRFRSGRTIFALQPTKNFQLIAAFQRYEKFFNGNDWRHQHV